MTATSPPPHPSGWYVLAFTDELAPGQVLTRQLADRELVLFRTESGEARASEAYCPHMGAHLGHGGTVVGDTLRCPFHHFRFDTEGRCVEGYPGHKAPPACRLVMPWVQEKNGTLIVWWDAAGRAPEWEVPALDVERWRPVRHATWTLRGHPQECSENSVDFGHFAVVHEYDACTELIPAHVEGPLLHAKYQMSRSRGLLQPDITTSFELWVWGLGYSIVHAHVDRFNLDLRTFVLPCPTAGDEIALRLATSLKCLDERWKLHPLASLLPQSVLEWVAERAAFYAYTADVRQDFEIWKNKTYVEQPRLASGDGPISLYRRYCRQFYPEGRRDLAAAR